MATYDLLFESDVTIVYGINRMAFGPCYAKGVLTYFGPMTHIRP